MGRAERFGRIADDIRRQFPDHADFLDGLAKPHGNAKPRDAFGCTEKHYAQVALYRLLRKQIAAKHAANSGYYSEDECAEMVLRAHARAEGVDVTKLRNLLTLKGSNYRRHREILRRKGGG
jgi:hypothetical protein